MQCPRCQHENPPGMKFCGECAAPLAATCPSCGAANPADNKFCGQCATPLRTGPTAQEGVAASQDNGHPALAGPALHAGVGGRALEKRPGRRGAHRRRRDAGLHGDERRTRLSQRIPPRQGRATTPGSPSDHAEAETCFRQAVDVARHQAAHGWELRAATSLGRLLGRQGKRDEARQTLADVYDRFTEGLDTADLREAKAMLEELS